MHPWEVRGAILELHHDNPEEVQQSEGAGGGHLAGRLGCAKVRSMKVHGPSAGRQEWLGHWHHWQVGGVWPGSGSGDAGWQKPDPEGLAYNAKQSELCSADSGSCRNGMR